jgi:hypothetical protein
MREPRVAARLRPISSRHATWALHELPPLEKAVPEEAPTEVGASCLDSACAPLSIDGRISRSTEIFRSADFGVRGRRQDVGERPLGFDGLRPHSVDGAVDR